MPTKLEHCMVCYLLLKNEMHRIVLLEFCFCEYIFLALGFKTTDSILFLLIGAHYTKNKGKIHLLNINIFFTFY